MVMVTSSDIANQSSVVSLPPDRESADAAPDSGRTADGRFTRNNKGGPGNPFNRQVAALRRALLARVTAEDIEEIVAVLLIKAKSGDLAAIKLLLSYSLGKPGPAVDPDTLDQQEWQMHQQAAVPPAAVNDVLQSLPAATVNRTVQIAWPCVTQQQLQPIIQGLKAADAADAAVPPPSTTPVSDPMESSPATAGIDRTRPPSSNGGRNSPPETQPANRSRRASRLPPRPSKDDPDYEAAWQGRIEAILFDDEVNPSDDKAG
jgi:hypothetical protein